jgi:hypothetical protein
MGEMGDFYRDKRDARKDYRQRVGVECPRCYSVRPNAHASILLPGQRCRVDGYVDPRDPKKNK